MLEFQAGETAPILLSLAGRGASTWSGETPESLIPFVEIDGRRTALHWQYNPTASHIDPRCVAFVYESVDPRLTLTWEWRAPAEFGPIEHQVSIRNLSAHRMWIPLQESWRFRWKVDPGAPLEQWSVEKGADAPSAVGTYHDSVPVGYDWHGRSSSYAHPVAGQPREIIPWFLVQEENGTGWYIGVEFSGLIRLALARDTTGLHGSVALDADVASFRTRLDPNEVFEAPRVFVGAFSGGPDGAGNRLHRWIRQVLNNPAIWKDPHYPFITNNSWGSGTDVDEALAHRMIGDSADLGVEMFHLDAGWFRGVGDWYADPQKFPHGLASLADDAHRHNLKFGLWIDWAQAGLDEAPGALNARDPRVQDWLVSDLPPDWKPEKFKGQTIDIGVPEAREWVGKQIERLVEDDHLDMLEHDGYIVAQGCVRDDHPHAPPDRSRLSVTKDSGFYFVQSTNSADVSYHATRAYYDIYARLRAAHPQLLLEICNDGGRMVDFGSAAHGDYFSLTDVYDPLSNRRAFYDASYVLPPAMLEAYVEQWDTPHIENFRYMLRSGMMGWLSIMMDTTAWSEPQRAAAKQELQLYKSSIRPLIRDADLYHIGDRPDGVHWDGMEYFDPARGTGVVFAFRGSTTTESVHSFRLQGLRPDRRYRLHFQDRTSADRVVPGKQLLQNGLRVELPLPYSSELVFIDEEPRRH